MKKEEALKRIESLENETKELRKIIETPDRTGKITDRIKNFKDACDELGISGSDLLVKITGMDKDKISIIAYSQLIIIVRALNEGWTPDWSNSKEYKWWPYFNMNSGFGFSDSYYDCSGSHTNVGSRLCFKSEALANYAGKQFESLYKEFSIL